MNEVVISRETALSCYRLIRARRDDIAPAVFHKSSRLPTCQELQYIHSIEHIDSRPLEILLYDHAKHTKSTEVRYSNFSSCNRGIAVRVNSDDPFLRTDNFLLVSPSFLLAQFASSYDFIQLFTIAMGFAGTYTLDPVSGEVISDLESIINKKALSGMIHKLKPTRWPGIGNLKKVAKYMEENSASPMETELYAKLALPTYLGGLGVFGLKMNVTINLSSAATKIAGIANVRVDFLHPESKVVVEYDSRMHHSGVEQSQRDKRRRDALQNDGYKCFSIVPQQISWCDTFNACMSAIVKHIKGRMRIRTKGFDYKQEQLFRYFRSLHKR